MNIEEFQYALALQETKGIGCITAKKLIAIYGSATLLYTAFTSGELQKEVNPKMIQKLFSKEALLKAEQEIQRALANQLECLYYLNDNYPSHLKNCNDAPLLIFKDGGKNNINNHSKIISIVGTRNITSYGRDFCKDLIESVKEHNPLIVSGFAYGVDICAHTEALKNNLPTLAVLAHGYGTLYPKEHSKYYAEVKESGGFLSEFNYNEPPYRENFLKRNRIVAGISQATIIIESAAKGGSLVTADIANSYNKDVFAVPGKTTDTYSVGCNNLIKTHKASLITSGEDLIHQLGWQTKSASKTKIIQPQLFVELDELEEKVYQLVGQESYHMDEISRKTNVPIYKISNTVFQLEMKGLIQVLPGKFIKKV